MKQLLIIAFTISCLSLPAVAAETKLFGEAIQGGLIRGITEFDASVLHDGEKVRVSSGGVFLLAFHRDASARSKVEISFRNGRNEIHDLEVKQRKYKTQRIDGLPPKKVTPDPELLERIQREVAQARKARAIDSQRTDFLSGWLWPATGRISGVYGSQRILNGKPRQPHYGVDIAVPKGTSVVAPADGIVTLAHKDMYYSGKTLFIHHGHGLSSAFLHLSKIHVTEGRRVKRGDLIAEVGSTGRSTGPHLDWRINLFEKRIDPVLVAGPMP